VVAPLPRLTRWAFVAVLGFGVQTAVLLLLVHAAGLHYLPALALAVTSAIVHNFVWHERWTWADRPAARAGTRVARFVRFTSVAALVSLAGGVALAALLIEWLHVPLAIANLATVLVLGFLNFAGADRLAFIPERQAHAGLAAGRIRHFGPACVAARGARLQAACSGRRCGLRRPPPGGTIRASAAR
jgi:putative flippase GtrA